MKYKFLVFLMVAAAFDAISGVKPAHTREVIGLDNEYKVDIVNTSNNKYLVQAWLEDLSGNKKNIPVVLTPPIFEIEKFGTGFVRLLPLTKKLPKVRESIFWLNIQEIPQKDKGQKNKLQMAVRTKIKIILRPEGLSMSGLEKASKELSWSLDGSYIIATNNSPYYLSMGELSVKKDGHNEMLSDRFNMVPPFSSQSYKLPELYLNDLITVKHGVINDFGGVNHVYETILNEK